MQRQELKLVARIVENLPVMTPDVMQGWINNPKGLKKFLSGLNPPVDVTASVDDPAQVPTIPDLLRWWANYEKLFNIVDRKPDLSAIRIPEKPEGVGPVRLIVVVKELIEWTDNHPLEGVQEALKKHFPCFKEYVTDLDAAILTHDRDPKNGSYAVWVKDVREADEEFASKSADDLKSEGHTGITTLERQLLEADYFWEKGEHLDQQKTTLCTGSRSLGGGVSGCTWDDSFYVNCLSSTDKNPSFRSRRVWA